MTLENRKGNNNFGSPFILIAVLFLFSGLSGYGTLANYISAILSGLILLFCANTFFKDKTSKMFLVFYIFYVLTSLINFSSFYYFLGTCVFGMLIKFSPLLIKNKVSSDSSFKNNKILLICSLVIWFSIVLVSIVTFSTAITGGRAFIKDHEGSLLGGVYSAAYGSCILAVYLTCILLNKNLKLQKKYRFLIFVGIVISIIHVFLTQSTITTAALLLGEILAFIFHEKYGKKDIFRFIAFFVFLFLFIFVITNIDKIGEFLINFSSRINNDVYSQRIKEMGLLLHNNTETSHTSARFLTLEKSFNVFISHPVFGIGYKVGNSYWPLVNMGWGAHSEILDSLAQYGLFGSYFLFSVYIIDIKKTIKSSRLYYTLPFVTTLLVLCFFNPFLSTQTNFIIFLVIPMLNSILGKKVLK